MNGNSIASIIVILSSLAVLLTARSASAQGPTPGVVPALGHVEMRGGKAAERLDGLNLLPAVKKKPWAFHGFPIMAWWPPPGTATFKDFQTYKEAGFSIYCANPDVGFEQALKYATQSGLSVIAWRECQRFGLPPPAQPVVFREGDPNIVGWIVCDEPAGKARVVEAITEVNRRMRADPTRYALCNLFPPDVQDPRIETVIEAAVRCGMPVISYDNYVINADGTDRTQEHFDNIERIRKASIECQVPFWAFALTTKHWRYRQPSESDLRWKQYTNLAYGAKGLWYFCYWGPTNWDNWAKTSIVNPANGDKTEVYEYVRAINQNVLAMGDVLLGLTTVDAVHTTPPAGHRAFKVDQYWIANIVAKDAMIGFFHDVSGVPYALVVNKRHGADKSAKETADRMELTFASDVKSVLAVGWLDGAPGKLVLKDCKATLPISGGTGVLLKAEIAH